MKKITPTMQDVAKASGVSVATVSRVLTKPHLTTANTRQKVEQAALDIGYYHARLVRPSRGVVSRLLLVIFNDIGDPACHTAISGMAASAKEQDYQLLLMCLADMRSAQSACVIDQIMHRQISGIILFNSSALLTMLQPQLSLLPPIIIVNDFTPQLALPCVHIDHLTAAFNAVSYLQQQGHRHIASIGGASHLAITEYTQQGYKQALHRHNISVDKRYIIYCNRQLESGMNALKRLLELPQPPSAFFCHNDQLALGILYQANLSGLRIPKDLSIMSMSDSKLAEYSNPPLTCIKLPFYQMGQQAVLALTQRLKSSAYSINSAILGCPLIVRKSVARRDSL